MVSLVYNIQPERGRTARGFVQYEIVLSRSCGRDVDFSIGMNSLLYHFSLQT